LLDGDKNHMKVAAMSPDFLDPRSPVAIHGKKLPHWQQGSAWQFVTFRLKDSLPADFLAPYRNQRTAWLRLHPEPWTDEIRREFHRVFSTRIHDWLDKGHGSCLLRDPEKRQAMGDVMMRDDGSRAELACWVIMPNHVHVLFSPHTELAKLIGLWKGVSARDMGLGPVWQRNYHDTLIRSTGHFAAVVRYIRKNAQELPKAAFTLWESSWARKI
jgi:REP element-mobilizing transposase RayT